MNLWQRRHERNEYKQKFIEARRNCRVGIFSVGIILFILASLTFDLGIDRNRIRRQADANDITVFWQNENRNMWLTTKIWIDIKYEYYHIIVQHVPMVIPKRFAIILLFQSLI